MKVTALPDFSYEKKVWKRGFRIVAGVDEVGRGSWVGPVVAGAVVWLPQRVRGLPLASPTAIPPGNNTGAPSVGLPVSCHPLDVKINDSKKLTARQREKAAVWIKKNCLSWGAGEAPVSVINRLGIGKATKMAFRRAIVDCNNRVSNVSNIRRVEFLLVDAFYVPYTKGIKRKNQLAIVKGDEKSISVAAASIVAKVYRDSLMQRLSGKHPQYHWERNKGYGTKEHQDGVWKYGITRLHRKAFVSHVRISSLSLEDV